MSSQAYEEAPAGPSHDRKVALEARAVTSGYRKSTVLRDINLTVAKGSVVALLGPNGAGKSTLLRTLAGVLRPTSGHILINDVDMTRAAPHRRTRSGLCLIPEGRGVFPGLTVRDNLRLQVPPWAHAGQAVDRAVSAFPILGKRLGQLAGTMSGGQQQMVALARAWNSNAEVVLLDEVSMGLAPLIVDEIFMALSALAAESVALLIVEQYVTRVLGIADDVYLLEKGTISFHGLPRELDEDALLGGYLGTSATAEERPDDPPCDAAGTS